MILACIGNIMEVKNVKYRGFVYKEDIQFLAKSQIVIKKYTVCETLLKKT